MTIDGIEISSSTNTFSPTGTGLTLTALKTGTSQVTVQNDSGTITKAAQAFVDAFNAVATTVKSNNGYNAATKTGQAFTGDMAARTVLDTLGNARSALPPELSDATFKTLASLGITIQRTGLLSLDTSKLNSAISTSPGETVKTLNAYGAAFNNAVSNMLGTNGTVANRISSLNAAVTRLTENKEAMEVRVGLIEKRYRAQFTALDKLVSSMQTVSSSLGQQLATLPTGSSN
jgi:flagellar hook-associated protein 2